MKFKSHKEVVPIKTKAAIEIIRKFCPELGNKSDAYLNLILNIAIKKGDVKGQKFLDHKFYIYADYSVVDFAKKLKGKMKNKNQELPEQLELPVQKEQEKKELYFTITVNNNFQN